MAWASTTSAAEAVGHQPVVGLRRRPGSNSAATPGPNDEPDAMDTRSLASVVRAHAQPSVGPPTTQSSGTNTSSRNISLNRAMPVSSRSGRTSMPGVAMSTRKQPMPSCLGASGSVRARQMAQSASSAMVVHTFWPVIDQPPSTRVGPGGERGQVAAGAGLAEHLAPRELAPQRRAHEPLLLARRAVADDGGQHPARHLEVGGGAPRPPTAPASITSCSTGDGVAPPRPGPVGHEVAARRPARARQLGRSRPPQLLDQGPGAGPGRLGLGRQLDGQRAPLPGRHRGRPPGPGPRPDRAGRSASAVARFRYRWASCSHV